MTDPVAGNDTGEVRGILNSGVSCPWHIEPIDFDEDAVLLRREIERDYRMALQVWPLTKIFITDVS